MSLHANKRSLSLLLAAVTIALPGSGNADYLYSVFRDACTVDTSLMYSAADPIIATVHLEKTEVNRISSNYLTYGGFSLYPNLESFLSTTTSGVTVKELTKTKGHLFALRLFKEVTPNSNQWSFMPYVEATVLDDCGPTKTCLFDAGQLLTDRNKRDKPRRIFSGKVGTPLTPSSGNEGAYTVPITSTEPLVLTGLPETAPGTWDSSTVASLSTATAVSAMKTEVWQPYVGLANIAAAMTGNFPKNIKTTSVDTWAEIMSPTDFQFGKMLKWLHGETRSWDLGDVYHASTAVVEAPERSYRDRSYPQFKAKLEKRPEMIYVGANDGMIHAFYAAPDLYWSEDGCSGARWQAGEEAWAYLPANMLAKTLVHVERGDERFFSQDLSCRFTDVMVDTEFTACPTDSWKWPWSASGSNKPYCGWRTILVCGQGWGGSWFVGLDITDPTAPFRKSDGSMGCTRDDSASHRPVRAMWEFTHLPATSNAAAMGKSWSLPFIGLVNFDGTPKWLSGFGSGYNTDMVNCPQVSNQGVCSANTRGSTVEVPWRSLAAFRTLNFDYDGQYPQHGDGIGDSDTTATENPSVWVMDIATGEILKRFDITGQKAVVADIPAVDSDFNGLVDAAYVGGWSGAMARIYFGNDRTTLGSIGLTQNGTNLCTITNMTGQRVVANHPTAFGIPPRSTDTTRDQVMTVLGSGLNSGDDPDMQRNNGNFWDIDANVFTDTGTSSCPTGASILCAENRWWVVNDTDQGQKPRLLGAPIFARQANGDDWLVYTTWSPADQCSKEGYAKLWCLDVTQGQTCKKCAGFDDNGNRYSISLYAGEQPPSAPVAADGNIYVAGEDGPIQQGISNSAGKGPNANSLGQSNAGSVRVTSWREVF